MTDTPQLPRSLWIGLIFLLGFLCIAVLLALAEIKSRQPPLPDYGSIANFTLTNQDDQVTTLADLTNHVWVADIIFTRCAGQCPHMTAQMKSLEDVLSTDTNVRLVTLTTDPDYDSPSILKRYGERFGADFSRWMFLTGTKKQMAGLAGNSLKLSTSPIKPADRHTPVDLFIHSTIFVVVDKHAELRGIFQTGGQGVDWTNSVRPQLLATVRRLERQS